MRSQKGISEGQIRQLVKITKSDSSAKKYTHDPERFKNLTTFRKWQRGKTIYTLGDKKGNLLGIVWFSRKKNPLAPNYPFTFAIRVYPPLRGKGYALKFMKEAFTDFKPKSVWLTTHIENLPAINLYKKFGFKELNKELNELVMIL